MSARRLCFALALSLGLLGSIPRSVAQTTDVNAEARVFFDRGNELLARADRASGRRRRRLLEEALQAFVSTLRIVRSRNALFNAALVLEQLDRPVEAFAYYREYLDIPGLSDDERRQAEARIDVLRPALAIVAVRSTPPGAEVFVDRLDLAPRGRTPFEIALPPGEHTLFFRHPHYEDAEARVVAETGATHEVDRALTPRPVEVRLESPGGGQLFLDGEPVAEGSHALLPGAHVARLQVEGHAPVERRFVVEAGDAPSTVRIEPGAPLGGLLVVRSSAPARVEVDGRPVGTGRSVEARLPPGTHRLDVRSEGRRPFTSSVAVEAGRRTDVAVTLAPEARRPLGALPHVALGVTAAGVAAWGGLAIRALRLRQDHDDACAQGEPSCDDASVQDVERANRAADATLGVAGALAVTTLILYLANRRSGPPSRADIEVSLGPGSVQLGGTF